MAIEEIKNLGASLELPGLDNTTNPAIFKVKID